MAGGNALIGRQLYPLMVEAGVEAVHVSPRMVYVDSSRPDLVDGFTRKTFTAMVEGIPHEALQRAVRAAFGAATHVVSTALLAADASSRRLARRKSGGWAWLSTGC